MTPRTFSAGSVRRAASLAALLVVLSGCGSGRETTAEAPPAPADDGAAAAAVAVNAMLEAAEAGDWETYVDGFYGEQHKFAAPEERTMLVERFRDEWGEKVLPALAEASEVMPRIEDDRALFERDGEVLFTLYKDDDGRWTFHL